MEYFSLIFTNHSLRATCATQLFDAGVPEALVQKQTGNKTLESLCLYERVTDNQRKVFSDIIQHEENDQVEKKVIKGRKESLAS